VWAVWGYPQHGPVNGPKIDIPANMGGKIVRTEPAFTTGPFSGGQKLYVVKWDNGQESKHYYQNLLSIGPFQTLVEFETAFRMAEDAELTIGSQGGFRRFRASLQHQGVCVRVELTTEQRSFWQGYLAQLAVRFQLKVREKMRARLPQFLAVMRDEKRGTFELLSRELPNGSLLIWAFSRSGAFQDFGKAQKYTAELARRPVTHERLASLLDKNRGALLVKDPGSDADECYWIIPVSAAVKLLQSQNLAPQDIEAEFTRSSYQELSPSDLNRESKLYDDATDEERRLYDGYISLMRLHRIKPSTFDAWVSNYRAVQARTMKG